jgi:hypothetical protein
MRSVIFAVFAVLFVASFAIAEDFEWNSGGSIDVVPTLGGSDDGWASYFVTTVENDTGHNLLLVELGFPCGGPGPVDWLVWSDVGGVQAPSGDYTTADYSGPFTPVDSNPDTFPPVTYTYIDISAEDIIIDPSAFLCIGYENPGMGGMVNYNGITSWGWYGGMWDPDSGYGRTAVLQVKANYSPFDSIQPTSLGVVKAMYK